MKLKFWINVITFVALAILLVASRADILEVFRHMKNLNLWILALTIPAQFLCFYVIAKVYQSYGRAAKLALVRLRSYVALAMEVNFVHHVFPSAGVSAFSYVGIRMKEFGVSTAQATMLQLVRTSFAFIAFIPMLLVGVVMLAAEDRASNFIILAASTLATLITLASALLVYVIGNKKRIHAAALSLVNAINWLIHRFRRKHPETIRVQKVEATLDEMHEHYMEVRRNFRAMQPVFWWSFAANLCELVLIYIVFVAHGTWINPGALIIAFAVANLAGLVALLPGGVGVYEPLMIAVLVSGGVPVNIALSAILTFRVIGMLLSLPTGYFLYHNALKRYARFNA